MVAHLVAAHAFNSFAIIKSEIQNITENSSHRKVYNMMFIPVEDIEKKKTQNRIFFITEMIALFFWTSISFVLCWDNCRS